MAADLTDAHVHAMIDQGGPCHPGDTRRVDIRVVWPVTVAARSVPREPGWRAHARLDRVHEIRQGIASTTPIAVPEMIKCADNVHELDDFHDGWLRRVGAVSITGHSHRAGQIEDRSVVRMTPPSRVPCRRLRSRCVVLADWARDTVRSRLPGEAGGGAVVFGRRQGRCGDAGRICGDAMLSSEFARPIATAILHPPRCAARATNGTDRRSPLKNVASTPCG